MPETFLRTKLFVPPVRPNLVPRPRLIERLNQGLELGHKLSLVSAPAGFGKTTLVSEWVTGSDRPVAWLSPDERDNDPIRFLTYLVAALQIIKENCAERVLALLQSPQPPPTESILTALLNEISTIPDNFVLVLDDYHVIDAKAVDSAFTFLLEHLPPQMHLVITTREDPSLPLARYRVRGQLTELRVSDLRFTNSEAARFLNQVMGLNLSAENIASLETRTEGWIAGLQLAALSMRGHKDAASFIRSFSGSHHFVLDYLVEEVLNQQSKSVQSFLLRTSILDRLCGPLCDAVRFGKTPGSSGGTAILDRDVDPHLTSSGSGQETLEYLERANLFIVPLDNERRWYRYHPLFADLLRQRLQQQSTSSAGDGGRGMAALHNRASVWYEDNGLEIEAFHHAAAANDIERTERLIEGVGVPLHYRGAAVPVLHWLESLSTTVLDARPSLWVTFASALFFVGQHTAVEQKLQAAEAALRDAKEEDSTQDLVGRIASIRATLAVIQHDLETIIAQSRLALEHLHPDNLLFRAAAAYTLGVAYHLQGDRAAASQSFTEVLSITESLEDSIYTMAAAISLGQIQAADNQLYLASKTFERALQMAGDPPQLIACEAFLGLACINYQWNDLNTAQQYGLQCAQLTQQMESIDTSAMYGVFLARLRLAQGDFQEAATALDEAENFARQHNFLFRIPEVAAARVLVLLRQEPLLQQDNLTTAADLAGQYELPISQARVLLAQGEPTAVLAVLGPLRRQMEDKGWLDEQLKIMILQALAHQAHGEKEMAVQQLGEALAMAEPGGFIRIFVDEERPMAQLLSETAARGIMPGYCGKLLAVFEAERKKEVAKAYPPPAQPLIDSLTKRELEILFLIAAGLKNQEIADQLFISLNTVLYHIKNIYSKLGVNKRTQAIAKAKEINLI